jgi:fatty-acyl-CoA synthase
MAAGSIRDAVLAHLELAHLGRDRPALLADGPAGDLAWSWPELIEEAAVRADALSRSWRDDEPRHVGVLLDNTPEMVAQLVAAGLGGHVVVGLNTTRRGAALLADIVKADCQVLVVADAYLPLLDGLDLGGRTILLEGSTRWRELGSPTLPPVDPGPDDLFMLVFTSGTGGSPKAVRITHDKVTRPGAYLTEKLGLTGDDVCYSAMPLFHSNGVMASFALAVVNGCTMALAPRFSASGFLDDVRRYGATYANYVGKPLSYVLATPPRSDDADTSLRIVFGNEAGARDTAAFARRFGCRVVDGFGSSENAVVVTRTPETPPGALGVPFPGVKILGADGNERPAATTDETGRVTNLDECVGELVNTTGAGQFAGYYNDDAATSERMRGGMYWSGDLAFRDADGFYWYAGRTADWLRVDGENLAAAPIEALLLRHPSVVAAAVYAVPDPAAGDQLVAALELAEAITPEEFEAFLDAQDDLSPKARPRLVRLMDALPMTATSKVLKRELAAEGALAGADTWWERAPRGTAYTIAGGGTA